MDKATVILHPEAGRRSTASGLGLPKDLRQKAGRRLRTLVLLVLLAASIDLFMAVLGRLVGELDHFEPAMYGPLAPERAVHRLRQVCHSLAEAHGSGLIHRDIKPANLSVCRYGRDVDFVKVLDFGLVKGEPGEGADPSMHQPAA